ncbi:MAG: protein phosphatase 2C domain-containing protein [Alphaproteobacteria bacterium]|nr:protein phosphatase 2C domain-containing protein [Alphaproteobacteria bacterium]
MNSCCSNIRIVATSVRGVLHRRNNIPCQDYFKHARGKNFVAVVSDGAGSAKFSKIGAKTACETLCDLLKNAPWNKIRDTIVQAVRISRGKLCRHRFNKFKNEQGLADFSATIIGMVYYKGKGLFFHIGDGAGIAFLDDEHEQFIASRPENGLFACETFFYTQQAWLENLRFLNFENAKSVFLMSDGVSNFSFSPDFMKIEKGFTSPINTYLINEKNKQKALRALNNTLDMPKAQRINSDDKTLVWIRLAK